jgi:hypothetical protein
MMMMMMMINAKRGAISVFFILLDSYFSLIISLHELNMDVYINTGTA